jgi:DNA-binding transcriptional LysR family regulator
VFVTVADCGNIRDAAQVLCRTQSAVSMTLKQLEGRIGGRLFETDRKDSLTDLGQTVHDVAAMLVRDHDHAIGLIESHALGRGGKLRIASVPSVAALLIPGVLRDFTQTRPAAEIDLVDTDSPNVRLLVATGQADIGIASPPAAPEGLESTLLFEDHMHLVCRADAPLAKVGSPLQWAHLRDARIILNESVRALASPGFQELAARAQLSVRNVTSLLALVEAGLGVTVLPGLATVALPSDLVALRLADPACIRQVSIVQRDGRVPNPLASAFAQHLTSAIEPMVRRVGLSPQV